MTSKWAVSVIVGAAWVLGVGAASEPCHGAETDQKSRIVADWMLKDHGADVSQCFTSAEGCAVESKMVAAVLAETPNAKLQGEMRKLASAKVAGRDARWRGLYVKACEGRRAARLASLLKMTKKMVFTKHYNMGGSHYAYTEGLSDAQAERHFRPGTALCMLEMEGIYAKVTTLITDPKGVIRDPDVSYDGKRVLFAWKKSDRMDDYHLYEMDLASRKIKQLTTGLGFADYEACYLPDGNILFNSTRCVQIVDCWWTEVSNLYICDGEGKHMRRVGFDQVHSNYPQVLADGRVIYTRWDYNDRGQLFPQPLFQMNIDGTGQTELYGNNSWFPTTIAHSRGLPGSKKILAILTGHHSHQKGKLAIIDPTKGRQEAQGVQLVSPITETKAVKVDAYGQGGDQWQYPYPLSDREWLVTFSPYVGGNRRYSSPFGIYYQDIDGRRELLTWDAAQPSNQPVPLRARQKPTLRPSQVDYRKNTGTYYVQDVYHGPGLTGIERGVVKKLRVVALEFRAAGVGSNGNGGPAGGALVSTPVTVRNGTWDVKHVIGETTVHEDGSAMFIVPARTPVYFQLLDEKGYTVQSMRSWSTLQPGEKFSCTGCHEDKNEAPPGKLTQAMKGGAVKLDPFYGPPRGFSFIKEIQPILDRHCVKCHDDRTKVLLSGQPANNRGAKSARPKGAAVIADVGESWRYSTVKPSSNGWARSTFDDSKWTAGTGGFGTAGTPGGKVCTTWNSRDIWLRRKITIPAKAVNRKMGFWLTHDEDVEIFVNGVKATNRRGYTTEFFWIDLTGKAREAIKAGENTLAVHCKQTGGGQFIDVALYAIGGEPVIVKKPQPVKKPLPVATKEKHAFSLLGTTQVDGRAKRNWSDAYLALTQNGKPNAIVNWMNVQSIPPMLPPYFAGSSKSKLLSQFETGHNNVKLSREEIEKIACWIDLLIPYCGSYDEAGAWSDGDWAKHNKYMAKRKAMEEFDHKNIEAYIKAGQP